MNNSQIHKLHTGLDHIKSNKLNPKGLLYVLETIPCLNVVYNSTLS